LKVQKLGNGPQEGPGEKEEAWGGVAWSANRGKTGQLEPPEGRVA